MYRSFFKIVIDVFLSVCGIIVLSIPMVIIAIAIKAESKGPALFKQKRLGKGQKEFTVYKFRTMCDHAFEKGGVASSESDNRITKVGNKIVYVGITNDLERRTAEHEREGMKFTAVDKIGRQTTREAAENWETARIHQYQENHGGETPMYNQNSSGK